MSGKEQWAENVKSFKSIVFIMSGKEQWAKNVKSFKSIVFIMFGKEQWVENVKSFKSIVFIMSLFLSFFKHSFPLFFSFATSPNMPFQLWHGDFPHSKLNFPPQTLSNNLIYNCLEFYK